MQKTNKQRTIEAIELLIQKYQWLIDNMEIMDESTNGQFDIEKSMGKLKQKKRLVSR